MGKTFLMIASLCLFSTLARAEGPREGAEHRGGPAPGRGQAFEPRSKGIPQYGQMHSVAPKGAKPMRTQVFLDRRSHAEVRRDPHVIVFNHVGYKPRFQWAHWYRDWGLYWRLTDWNEVRTVTCEAVNNETEQLYPVTETREGNWVWTSQIVNDVAARALDECGQEAGRPDACSLVERECWNSIY